MDTSTENLVDALSIIKQHSYTLNKYIDEDNYEEVINTSVLLLSELRNGALSPKDYYEIWTTIYEQLLTVESYFCQVLAGGMDGELMYEQVQYTATFIPRLYLMILVGSCCIRMKLVPAKKILYDTLEMCKGIQHPMRGLFLRNFFICEMKDKFPYPGCRYETENGGDVNDSVDCIIRNFVEMNHLWIRMQGGKTRDKETREKERKDLKVLVGTNLACLSQLEGIDANYYSSRIQPALVNEIISCNDAIAQEYLIESMIQVFPTDFHIRSLPHTLECLCHLDRAVKIDSLMDELLERIQGINQEEISEEDFKTVVQTVCTFISELKEKDTDLPLDSLFMMINSFMKFIIKNKEDCFEDLNVLYDVTYKHCFGMAMNSDTPYLIDFFKQPIDKFGLKVLESKEYIQMFEFCTAEDTSAIAIELGELCIRNHVTFSTVEEMEKVFKVLHILYNREDLNEQLLFSSCLHCIATEKEEDVTKYLVTLAETISTESSSTTCYIPLLTIANILMKILRATSAPEPLYAALETVTGYIKKVNLRYAVIAMIDFMKVATQRKEYNQVESVMNKTVETLKAMEGKSRCYCHKLLINQLLCLSAMPADKIQAWAEDIVKSDEEKSMEVEMKNSAFIQCALMYAIKSETNPLFNEEKATELWKKCQDVIEKGKLSAKETTAAKAFLLRDSIALHLCNANIVSQETLQTMLKEIEGAEKSSRATKKLVEEIKPYVM